MRPSQIKLMFALAAVLGVSAAGAAKWEPVVAVNGERVELDKQRITRQSESKALAWTRLALDRDLIDEYGLRYTAVEALNRYDCEKRTFATVKRVYRRDGQLVREETVATLRELAVEAGGVDDKLLTEACKPRTVSAAQAVADAAARIAAEAREPRPTVMYADMRSTDEKSKATTKTVADKPAEAKPADAKPGETKPGETKSAEAKPPEIKPGERPRFIELPKIDKSQLEGAAPADAKSAAKPSAKPQTPPVVRPAERPAVDRHEIERQYATSGPRKAPKPKAPEPAVEEHRNIHWSYEGEGSPANWAKLRSDYATCATGRRQSPIDIRDSIKVDLEPIQFDYKMSRFNIVDNGHTIQVNVGEGSSIRVMERTFQLVQFHFHKPSEERVAGRAFDMVVHFVHKDDEGKLAVVAVLLEKGSEQPLIQTLWNNMPLEQNQEVTPAAAIDLNQLLPPPERRAYYTYMGSLTTPPCTEEVLWMVLKQPLQISAQQIGIFGRLYPNNARPVQPTNGRLIKENR